MAFLQIKKIAREPAIFNSFDKWIFNYTRKNFGFWCVYCPSNSVPKCTKLLLQIDYSIAHRQDVGSLPTPLKEVIQPHVLVRLPCYDFTPVISLTLDGFLPCGLEHRFRVLPTPMAWRAVCTRPGNEFTPTFWFGITSKFSFMWAGFSPQSELGPLFWDWLHLTVLQLFVVAIVSRV